ncbi:ABC transporter permease subunit [Bartonella sp. M0283]|uniref:ABC transporter permease subunit n=1 Tax=Bartonella sp. M0283 TaxID=2751016 RepID=UPI0018DCF5E5|nr:ABC transporter permease subunit [Bartonella sp. M0283]MBI0163301.1 ABC transporter permease subunit [Bartonella sp. M0283]
MLQYLLKKIGYIIPTFIGITLVSFIFVHTLPGDPVLLMAGERGMSEERHAQLMAEFGFDRPYWQQYLDYLWGVLHGNLGTSFVSKRSVAEEFFTLFPATLELAICAIIIAIFLGIVIGVIASVKRGSWFDQTSMGLALTGYSMPIFWWGLLLIMLFSGKLGWTPVSGRISLLYYFDQPTGFMLIDSWLSGEEGAFESAVSHLILPTLVLATVPLAVIARQTRSAMLEVLGEDYVRTAKAKGLSTFRVVAIHALRNAFIPIVTTIGLQIGMLMGGAILTETIFSWPGIGKWMIDSISRRDYESVQGGLLMIAVLVMVVNLVVDLLYGFINPRVRHSQGLS